MLKRFLLSILLAFTLLPVLNVPVFAQDEVEINQPQIEEILDFNSVISVNEDATIHVVETIKVRALGQEIKRGIYRDFPNIYKTSWGLRTKTGFDIISVKKDGIAEPYHTENQANGVRVYFGLAEVFLSPGVYTYQFEYTTDRQIAYLEDSDRFFYNITGNGWVFPILNSSAKVLLPTPISQNALENTAFWGPQGADYQDNIDITVNTYDDHTEIIYLNRNTLSAGEGFTVQTLIPKGLIYEPTEVELRRSLIMDNLPEILFTIGAIGVAILAFIVWYMIGRDPDSKAIYPQFNIPPDLSPATARFLDRMGFDNEMISVIVISLGVKGFIRLEESKGMLGSRTYTVHKLKEPSKTELSREEEMFMDNLLPVPKTEVKFSKKYSVAVQTTLQAIKLHFTQDIQKNYFSSNIVAFIIVLAAALGVVAIYFMASGATSNADTVGFTMFSLMWFGVLIPISATIFKNFFKGLSGKNIWQALQSGCSALFILPFFLMGIAVVVFTGAFSPLVLPAMIILVASVAVLPGALKARNTTGRELQDTIEGLKMFIIATEEEKIKIMNNQFPKSMDMFNKYFPYALALGVETTWVNQFEDVIRQAQLQEQSGGYNYGWYSSANMFSASSFANSMSSSFSSTISSSSTPPSSSGGGGGGSGGGGGGGGGGGW